MNTIDVFEFIRKKYKASVKNILIERNDGILLKINIEKNLGNLKNVNLTADNTLVFKTDSGCYHLNTDYIQDIWALVK